MHDHSVTIMMSLPFCRRCSALVSLIFVTALLAPAPAFGQFVAYNDHAPGGETSANTTTWNVLGATPGSSGLLSDSQTGAPLPVTLTISITPGEVVGAGTQGSAAAGSPLYAAFDGFVDFQGTPNPSIEITGSGLVTYTFTGLNPLKRYSFMGSAVRGNESYTDRWTLFELAGALAFTSAHTPHALTTAQVSLISPNQAAINTGANHIAATGDMAVWENIDPGPEGSFAVTCQQYVGPVPDGSSAGSKGYAMTGLRLEEFDFSKSPVTITNQPQSQTVDEARSVTFTVAATGNPPPTFQWFRDEALIPNETNATYTLPLARLADDGAVFSVVAANIISNLTYTAVSSNALLRVNGDFTPPTLVDVQAVGSDQVKVTFSERVTPETATDFFNFAITSAAGAVDIDLATLDATETIVYLRVATLTENISYTLSVSDVADQSSSRNVIAPGSQKTFSSVTFTPLTIGNATLPGGIAAVPGGYDLQGSGADIVGARDQFQFGYQQRTGDFDLRARLAGLTITDAYVKAGLMVRESLQDNSRFAAMLASSAQLGCFWQSRTGTGVVATLTGPITKFPANYPWAWLRLRRVGNDFTGFGSFDGQAWQQLGAVTMPLPSQIFFGMAVTAGNTNALATAQFRDIGPVESPTLFTFKPHRESIGPSNRRTGLMFSEIMYHAKPRADGKILDFVEIYNGDAIFIDLTGWKISGGIDYAFPNGFKLGAGQFVVIASNPEAVQSVYGLTGVLGPYLNNLNNQEDTLRLRNQAGAIRAELTYSSEAPWPAAADGAGHSLVCVRPSYGEDDVRAWAPSQLVGGSPGFDDPLAANRWAGVVINEFLAATNAATPGFIELYNASNTSVDLAGCILTDSFSTNKYTIANDTRLEARNWLSFSFERLGFALAPVGGTLYFVSADGSRVLDSIRYGAQETAISTGRVPDGAGQPRRLAGSTPGSVNTGWRPEAIVINEVMYKPISGDPDDEYIELYNRSAQAINLSGWRFTSGIDFTFPAGSTIAGDGYLVVAHNAQRLLTNYPQLKAATTVGDFSGGLRGRERIALARPGANTGEFINVAEVIFMTGGRWPELANGGGSSLELTDAHADPFLASNWAASDETQKSTWATYSYTDTLTLANQSYAANKFAIMSHGAGEYLLDDFEVMRTGLTNVLNNPGLENGRTNWTFYGTHIQTSVQTGGAFAGTNCLHVRATEVGDEGPNSIRGALSATLPANGSVTIRVQARWLAGWPELLLRIRGNGVEFPLKLQIPANLGTPGLPNSARVNNAGPSISETSHFPAIPVANEPVLVTARLADPDGIGSAQLIYRIDSVSNSTNTIVMRDDGSGGDALANDGLYSALLPGRPSGVLAFRIQAQDGAASPALSTFPSDPRRECVIRWNDPAPFGSFAHYHLWSTAASASDVSTKPPQDRSYRDCTIIYDHRVMYNAAWRNKGSPFHNGAGSYSTAYADDDLFLGSDKHVLRSTGNGGDESTSMASAMAYWIGEKMGIPFNNTRYVRFYRNGTLHYKVDYDMEVPDRSLARDWFGGGGLNDTLYKIAGWFEYDDNAANGTGGLRWANMGKKPSSGPPYKLGAYRFNFQSHPGGRTANDYSLIFNLVTAAASSNKLTPFGDIADVEEWMRMFAMRRIVGDWDHWTYQNTGQNMYLYAPLGERARLLPWDMDFVLGLGDAATQNNLLQSSQDSTMAGVFLVPAYRRMLWRAYQDAVNGPLVKETSDAQFNARRSILTKNNVGATSPSSLQSYVSSRRTFLLNQITINNAAAFTIATPNFTTNSATATITGTAPFGVATIEINGIPYPVTWTSVTAWNVKVPLGAETNVLQIVGKDLRGNPYLNATGQVTVIYTGAVPQPSDWLSINEIMYNAAATDAEYIEILNTHPTYAFDLSGYQLKGADFTFANGTFVQPNGYVLIVKDSASFAAAYGATIPIAGEYAGRLDNLGETLSLVKPGVAPAQDLVIDEVHYESIFPWPASANGFGPSLQRIDPAQDTWRAGNWAVTALNDLNRATPGRANVTRAALEPFPAIWINEALANNQAGATDAQGEREPWIELYNSSAAPVDLSLYYLSNDPSNAAAWQFPIGATIGAGEFLVIWADGQPEQTTATEIHTSFRLNAASGVVAVGRLQSGGVGNLDYLYYPTTAADQSYGSIAEGDIVNRRLLFIPTPGAANNPGNLLVPVSINEWMASNTRGITDPADADFDDWFELYNRGTTPVDLTGYFISDATTNSTKFRIPAGYTIAPQGYLLVWADEETAQNTPARADLHVNFKIAKGGDTVALFTPNGALLDAVTFTGQTDNISAGRYPDGAAALFSFPTPSPRSANVPPSGTSFTQIAWDGAQLTIGWRTIVGRNYRLEFANDLQAPVWNPVGANIAATSTITTRNTNFGAADAGFFRVVQLD